MIYFVIERKCVDFILLNIFFFFNILMLIMNWHTLKLYLSHSWRKNVNK